MALRLLTARPEALDALIADELAAVRARDALAPVSVLVGGTLLRPYLRRRLAELGRGHANVHMLLPGELGLRLAEHRMIAAGRRPVSALADRALVHEIAREASGYFAPVREAPGFAEVLARLFRELRGAALTGEAFAAGAGGEEKLAELAALYSRYLDARAGVYDGQDCLEAITEEDARDLAIIVHGVWQMPLTLRRALQRLAVRVPVTVLLPRSGTDADGAHREVRDWLASLGVEEQAAAAPPAARATALAHLQAHLFAEPAAYEGPDESVALISASDRAREAREAVRACLGWVAEGIPAYEIAIVARDPEAYRPFVQSACREAGVELYVHSGTPLAERPLGRQALRLLDLMDGELPRGPLMELLGEMRVPEETWQRLGGILPSSWDRISRRAGVLQGLDSWRERLGAFAAEQRARASEGHEHAAERARTAETLLAFVEELAGRFAAHHERASWSEHVAWLARILRDYVEGSEGLIEQLGALAELDELSGEVPFARFREAVAAAVAGLHVEDVSPGRPAAFARRGLNLLDAASARHLSFRGVVVLGLTERAFPPPVRQDPLLLDAERRRLAGENGWELPLRAQGEDPEPMQFLAAVCGARERLQLSFARAEESGGRAKLPSSFLRAAAGALVGERVSTEEVDSLDPRLYERVPAGRIGAGRLGRALGVKDHDRTLLELDRPVGTRVLERDRAAFGRARLLVRARRWTPHLTPFDGLLTAPECGPPLEEALGEEHAFSPTSLERYARCPYSFFLGRVLGGATEPEPEEIERIDPLDRGSLMHSVFERFLAGLGEERPAVARREKQLAQLLAIADEECAAYEQSGLTGHPLLWAHDRGVILADLRRWFDLEVEDAALTTYSQARFEVPFGLEDPGSTAEPVAIPIRGGTLLVKGRIDRLEYDPGERFRVIDYKTGSSGWKPGDDSVDGGRALQLPVYMLAASERLGIPAKAGSAAYHYASRRGGFKRATFSGTALGGREDGVGALLAALVGSLRAGDFHATPEKPVCRGCDFNGVCDESRIAAYEEKQEDDLVRRLVELREAHP